MYACFKYHTITGKLLICQCQPKYGRFSPEQRRIKNIVALTIDIGNSRCN